MSIPTPILTNNSPTPAPTANVGFKVSKPGYDANKTAGSNLVFNSSWPSLPIVLETTVTNTVTSGAAKAQAVAHNLGFPPFAMAWAYGGDPFSGNVGNSPYGIRFPVPVDSTNAYITMQLPNSINLASVTKVRIMVFNLDISTDIDYTLDPGSSFNMPYDNNFGIKIVKQNKNINSTDMRDFALHSRCQSPLIQAVKTQQTVAPANISGSNGTVQYTNVTSKPVWVYGYIKSGQTYAFGVPIGAYIPLAYYSQAYPQIFTDGFVAQVAYNSPDTGATIVILRDPMFASNPSTVVY